MQILSASIIPADGFIAINGEGYSPCDIAIDPHDRYGIIHAIQWFGTHGQYEHARGPSLPVESVTVIEAFLPAWRNARALALRERHDTVVRELEHTADMITTISEALPVHDQQIEELAKGGDHGAAAGMQIAADRMRRERTRLAEMLEAARGRHSVLAEQEKQAGAAAHQAELEAADPAGEALGVQVP